MKPELVNTSHKMFTGGRDLVTDIKNFHEKFDLKPLDKPGFLPKDLMDFRTKFLDEELDELKKGIEEGNLGEVCDGLIDLVYVALGTLYLMRFPTALGWAEVHNANMSKVKARSAEDSKRGHASDIVKPQGWRKPDIDMIIKMATDHLKIQEDTIALEEAREQQQIDGGPDAA